jgi:putative spermidine/putrescine transport system substrate-binding protein
MLLLGAPRLAQADTGALNFASAGGVVKDVETEVYLRSFTQETGIEVNLIVGGGSAIPPLLSMIKANKPIWDVVELGAGTDYAEAVNLGLLEPLDYTIIDPENRLPAFAKQKYLVGYAVQGDVLVQRTDKLPAGKKMTSWADFWDVETFPGPRSLRNRVGPNLEFALIADGVNKDDVYRLLETDAGAKRAFKKMDDIKPHIVVWWETTSQSVQLLSDGEAHFAWTANGRIEAIRSAGVPLEAVWNGGAMETTMQGVVKGTAQKENAMRFVNHLVARPELALKYIQKLPYPGFLPGAYDTLPPEKKALLPTLPENMKQQFLYGVDFWASGPGKKLAERWDEWVQT